METDEEMMDAIDEMLAEDEVIYQMLDPTPALGSTSQRNIIGGQTDHDVQQHFPGSFHDRPIFSSNGDVLSSHPQLPAQYPEPPFNNPLDESALGSYPIPYSQDAVTAQNLENMLRTLLTSQSVLHTPNVTVPTFDTNTAQCAQITENIIDAMAAMLDAFCDRVLPKITNPTVPGTYPSGANMGPSGPAASTAPTSSPPPPAAQPVRTTTQFKPRKLRGKKTEERNLFLVHLLHFVLLLLLIMIIAG